MSLKEKYITDKVTWQVLKMILKFLSLILYKYGCLHILKNILTWRNIHSFFGSALAYEWI